VNRLFYVGKIGWFRVCGYPWKGSKQEWAEGIT
jgi:hypothetical protein